MNTATKTQRRGEWIGWALTLAILATLFTVLALAKPPAMTQASAPTARPAVTISGPRELEIDPSSTLLGNLSVDSVQSVTASDPVLLATGSIVAQLTPGVARGGGRWQFASPELLAVYSEWLKSGAELEFTRTQQQTTKALDRSKVDAQTQVVDRLAKLVEAGSDSPKDLALERANLAQLALEGQKSIHEAETAARTAEQAHTALQRQLEQAGADPTLLRDAKPGSALLVADVPEAKLDQAREGMHCAARFYGLGGAELRGVINRTAPTLTREQRTLRVLIVLDDTQSRLRPGMFADVSVGIEARATNLIPLEGVLHVGRADYVLVGNGSSHWRVTEVTLGETRGDRVEVVRGAESGSTVLGAGAILLKPYVVEALGRAPS